MDMQDLHIFARVAALQNLSAVGQELSLTPGTISKRLQALEDELGVRLFDRTTRSIRITAEGSIFVDYTTRILAELDKARASVGTTVTNPKGRIKLATPASLGRIAIATAVADFMRAYPEVDVYVNITDRLVNLQEEGYDVAIRSGTLSDSSLIAKRLASDLQVLVASPRYIQRHGAPSTGAELAQHSCLMLREQTSWTLGLTGASETVRVGGRLRSNNSEFLYQSAIAGEGILRTSHMRAEEDLAAGRLVTVLPAIEVATDSAIWAVYPSAKYVAPRLRVLLDFLGDWFKDAGALTASQPSKLQRT